MPWLKLLHVSAVIAWAGSLFYLTIALALVAALAIGTASDPIFAASGVAAIAVLAGLFSLLGLGIRRLARGAKHLGGPVTRLGIAALERPGAPTGRLAISLGLGLTLLVTLAATGRRASPGPVA